ncbi:MAG: hypothetical protein ABEJ92_08435 [Halobacteriales archaeon]
MSGETPVARQAVQRARGVLDRAAGARRWVPVALGVALLEASLVAGYFALVPAEPTGELRYLAYPFVWINAGVWAVRRSSPTAGSRAHAWLARALAAAYFVLLLWVPGNVGLGTLSPAHLGLHHLRVAWLAPGWGPIVAYDGIVRLYLVPFEVVGYASLAYLVYANLLAATRSALSGALGLVTCVGCTVPVLAPLVGLLGGPAASLATTAYAYSYDIGTAVFLLALGLLAWSHRRHGR